MAERSDEVLGLAAANAKLRELKAAGVKTRGLVPIERARRKPTSLKLAIYAKCWECAGGGQDGAGFTKETIRTCSVACPLRGLRPFQRDRPFEGGDTPNHR